MTELRGYELKKRWLILIAFILHSLFILFFCFIPFESIVNTYQALSEAPIIFTSPSPAQNPLNQSPSQQQQQELDPQLFGQAALKPRASLFGATEEEQEIPEFTPGITDSESKNDNSSIVDTSDPGLTNPQQNDQNSPDQSSSSQQSQEPDNHQQLTEQKESAFIQESISNNDKKKNDTLDKPRTANTPSEKKSPNQASRHNTGDGKKNASPIKRTLSFTDLARGFLESSKNEGQDWLKRDGNENIRPGIQELKYLSYLQKIYWNLQNIIKQYKIMPEKYWPQFLEVTFLITFDRQGTISDLSIIKRSGCDEYDNYCKEIFRNNNCDYPRIPTHIPEDTMTIPFSIILSLEKPRIRFMYNNQ